MNQIKTFEELKGKTIVDFKTSHEELWLKFSDNSFTALEIQFSIQGFGDTQNSIGVSKYDACKTEEILVDFGIITRQEFLVACDLEEKNDERLRKMMIEEDAKRYEEAELLQLKKLKEKYE